MFVGCWLCFFLQSNSIKISWHSGRLGCCSVGDLPVLATAVLLVGLCRRNHDDLIGAIAFIRNVDRIVGALP